MKGRPLSVHLARLVWLGLLPLLALAAALAAYHVHTDQAEKRASAGRRASLYAAQIDGFLEARIQALGMLANSPLADDPRQWPALYAEARAYQQSFDSHVIFADAERQMLFNTRVPFGTALPRLPEAKKGHAAAPLALATGKPAVGDIVQGPVVNQPLVAIVVPGLRDGKVRHLLLVTTTTRELQQRVDALPRDRNWALTVRDGAGDVIAAAAPPGFDSARDVDADWRFTATSRFSPWTVSVEAPRKVVRQPLYASIALLLAGIALATLAGLLGARRLARRIEGEVASLAEPGAPDAVAEEIAEIAAARRQIATAQAELRASEKSHRELFAANPHPMWVYDLETLAFLAVNEAAIRHYGYGRDEFLAMTIKDIRPAEDIPRLLENVARVGDGLDDAGTWRHRTRDGRLIDVEIVSHPMVFAGRRAELVLAHDVTARRQAEDALRQRNAELEQFNRATVDREIAMIDLKRQVNALARELGRPPAYDLTFMDAAQPTQDPCKP